MTRFFHKFEADEDPRDLLDPSNQWSTPWGGPDHGPCDKCEGDGEVEYLCRSCLEDRADSDCPACGGRVRYRDVCPACEGSGIIDRTKRRGISVFPSLRGLYRYLVEEGADLDGCVVIELAGAPTGDLDLDADQGALLVRPTEICARHPIDRDAVAALREHLDPD